MIAEQGDPLPPSEALAPAKVEEVPEDVRQNWHTALESFLKEYQSTQASSRLSLATGR